MADSKKGASMEKDGKTWYWCPLHVKEGLFDGLYMPHKPEDHDEWARKKKEKAEKQKRNKQKKQFEVCFTCCGQTRALQSKCLLTRSRCIL